MGLYKLFPGSLATAHREPGRIMARTAALYHGPAPLLTRSGTGPGASQNEAKRRFMDMERDAVQDTGSAEAARRQDQLRAVAVGRLRQKIIRHIPYPPFRDETLAMLDEMLKVFGFHE